MMPYGSALQTRSRAGDPAKIATLARLLNPTGGGAFRSSYTGDVANDFGGGGKPMVGSPARRNLAIILNGGDSTTGAATGSTSTGSGGSPGADTPTPTAPSTTSIPGITNNQGAGNAGNSGNAGAAGDYAGHPGAEASRSATPSDVASSRSFSATSPTGSTEESNRGYLDIGPVGKGLLSAASILAPMPYSAIPTLLGGAGRLYNALGPTSDIRAEQGLPALNFGQAAGAAFDLNGYGDLGGNATVANPDQLGQRLNQVPAYKLAGDVFNQFGQPAETQQGASYQPGPGGILGFVMRAFGLTEAEARAMSPDEIDRLVHPNTSDTAWPTAEGNMPLPGAGAPPGGSIVPPGPAAALPAMSVGGAGVAPPSGGPAFSTSTPVYSGNGNEVDKNGVPNSLIGYRQADGTVAQPGAYSNAGQAISGNFAPGQGQAGTVAGGTFGNQNTGGMAGPVNRNASTGMLSRI